MSEPTAEPKVESRLAIRRAPPQRASTNTQISISLSTAEEQQIATLQNQLGFSSRSEYIRRAAADPQDIAKRLNELEAAQWGDLAQAANDYQLARMRLHSRFQIVEQMESYQTILYPYSSNPFDPGLLKFQRAIRQTASELPTLGKQNDVELSETSANDFDVMRRTGFLQIERMLYLFPFLLTEFRRPFWGILPYGHHRKIGLYFKNWHHQHLRDWLTLPTNLRQTHNGKTHSWFGQLVRALSSPDTSTRGEIYVPDGFLHQEILQPLLGRHGPPDLVQQFERLVQPVLSSQIDHHSGTPERLGDNDLFLFDLSSRHKLDQKHFIEFPHGLDIPVGIGFTLTMLMMLREQDNWIQLINTAQLHIRMPEYQSLFADIGIAVNE